MGNKTVTKTESTNNDVLDVGGLHGKTEEEIRAIRENLTIQHNKTLSEIAHLTKVLNAKGELSLKEEGAIELTLLMLPKEKENDTEDTNRTS